MSETKNFQEPSEDKIKGWKEKHKEIFKISITDEKHDNKKRMAFLRKPNMTDLERATASDASKKGSFNRSLWNNLLLECDPEICEERTDLMLAAQGKLADMIEISDAEIVKL